MRRIAVFLLILSWTLTGCSLSLPPPTPEELFAVFRGTFDCAFTGEDSTGSEIRAVLVRSASGDTLTVEGDTVRTVIVAKSGTSPAILTRGSEAHPPLTLPLPDGACGAAAFLALFSILPDADFTAVRGDGGIHVTNRNGSITAHFSDNGIPERIRIGAYTAVITSFAVTGAPVPDK